MRFKCVNKNWYNLIRDPKFVTKHLLLFNNNNDENVHNVLLKSCRNTDFFETFIFLLSFSQRAQGISPNILNLRYPYFENIEPWGTTPSYDINSGDLQILGPCNGIYCLYSLRIALTNPSIREFKFLPGTYVPTPIGTYSMLRFPGFGFDPRTNDYKVILVMDSWLKKTDQKSSWWAQIYSLSSNCWRKVDTPVPAFVSPWNVSWVDTYFNGAFHWWGYDHVGDVILSFHMADEVFHKIKLPELLICKRSTGTVLISLKESLAVITYPYSRTETYFDLWVLKDYGDDQSWTNLLRIGPIEGVSRLLGFLRNDQCILEERGELILYDPNTQVTERLKVYGDIEFFQAAIYVESLVSLKGSNGQNQSEISLIDVVPEDHFVCC